MRILIWSPAFFPSVGGLESIMLALAEGFSARGHEVTVLSTTPDATRRQFRFKIVRCPSAGEFVRQMRWCDVYFQGNVSLKGLGPWLTVRRPLVLAHHGIYVGWPGILKRLVTRAASNISVSNYVAEHLPVASVVIPNAYRDDVFQVLGMRRERDLVCVSRLVSDKGIDVLLEALVLLDKRGLRPTLSIVGAGPELPRLRAAATALDLDRQVTFTGVQQHDQLVRTLNAHKIMVIPSRWEEPFGIVALEGIACGCAVIGTAGGGLPEAIGNCGLVVARKDPRALADGIQRLLGDEDQRRSLQNSADQHLAKHSQAKVIDAYLEILSKAALARTNRAGAGMLSRHGFWHHQGEQERPRLE